MSTLGGASGFGSGSGAGTERIDERMREFISLEITHNILEQIPVIFGTVKEGILEILGVGAHSVLRLWLLLELALFPSMRSMFFGLRISFRRKTPFLVRDG